jgi:hypothetical protein
LRVSGRLEKDGKLYWLYNARDVSVVENELSTFGQPSISAPTLFDLEESSGDK